MSEYDNRERLHKFNSWVDLDQDAVFVDETEVAAWHVGNPQPYLRDDYLGLYDDIHGGPEEPHAITAADAADETSP